MICEACADSSPRGFDRSEQVGGRLSAADLPPVISRRRRMRFRPFRPVPLLAALGGMALFLSLATAVQAQVCADGRIICCPPVGMPCPWPPVCMPCPCPSPPAVTSAPRHGRPPGGHAEDRAEKGGGPPAPEAAQPTEQTADQSLSNEAGQFGETGSVAIASPNYIDSAIPHTNFRLRFDSAYGDNEPDRAEFFYPKCGCFANPALLKNPATAALFDPHASGPPNPTGETNVDYQEVEAYLEVAVGTAFPPSSRCPISFSTRS